MSFCRFFCDKNLENQPLILKEKADPVITVAKGIAAIGTLLFVGGILGTAVFQTTENDQKQEQSISGMIAIAGAATAGTALLLSLGRVVYKKLSPSS